jgi:hypothetical protein
MTMFSIAVRIEPLEIRLEFIELLNTHHKVSDLGDSTR